MKTWNVTAAAAVAGTLAFGGAAFAGEERDTAPRAGSAMSGDSVVMQLGLAAEDHIVAQERTFWLTPQTEVFAGDGRKIRPSSLEARSMVRIDFYWGEKRKLLAARITVVSSPKK